MPLSFFDYEQRNSTWKIFVEQRKKSLDVYNSAKSTVANALAELKNLKAINENSLPVFAKFEALIKELGIPMPQEIAAQKQNIQDYTIYLMVHSGF